MNKKQKVIIILTVICSFITIVNAAYHVLFPMFLSFMFHTNLNDAASIGIIGAADGPTSIYVGNPQSSYLITIIFTLLSIIGIIYLVITKKNKNN